jgi:hypothetical protein
MLFEAADEKTSLVLVARADPAIEARELHVLLGTKA